MKVIHIETEYIKLQDLLKFAAAVSTASCSNRFERFADVPSEPLSSTTVSACNPFLARFGLSDSPRLTSSSTLAWLLTGMSISTSFRSGSSTSVDSSMAILCAPFCAENDAIVQVTRIIRIVPLSTLSFSSRIGSPSGVVPRMTL